MNQLYEYSLENGDTIIFKTDIYKDKVISLPVFNNHFEFIKYFREKENVLEIIIIMKSHLH